ncbi:MAG: helix-turn-helix domain-containing protein [Planctomycetota bacterium]|jgi:excisionase family DNA binding protein
MAGMFYSIKEVAEKLNLSEEEIKELVNNGKLRGIPDGGSFLFKIDEIDPLLEDASLLEKIKSEDTDEAEAQLSDAITPPEEEKQAISGEEAEQLEEFPSEDLEAGTDISLELEADDTVVAESTAQEPPEEEQTAVEETKGPVSDEAEQSEIFLASTGSLSDLTSEDLTSGDTALTQEGVSVLGETDSEYKVTQDTKGETSEIAAGEPSLEEIEEDVNLDSFGSGSGLLDLSLQADDTSLGGILDDIYMSEGEEGKEAMPVEGSEMDMAAEADHIIAEEEPEAPVAVSGVMPGYIESRMDTTTTTLIVLTLLVSLGVAVFTSVIVLRKSVGPMLEGFILYALGGCLILAIALGGASIFTGGDKTKTKKPKAKKEKKAKPKKEKPKKEKKKKEKKKKEKKKKS